MFSVVGGGQQGQQVGSPHRNAGQGYGFVGFALKLL